MDVDVNGQLCVCWGAVYLGTELCSVPDEGLEGPEPLVSRAHMQAGLEGPRSAEQGGKTPVRIFSLHLPHQLVPRFLWVPHPTPESVLLEALDLGSPQADAHYRPSMGWVLL